jgi:hypothetical protein
MSTQDHHSHALTQEDLDRLLAHLAFEAGPHTDLSLRMVDDYIQGRASAEEQSLVESAMASSSGLREEVLALAAIARRGPEFDALQPPHAPRRREPPVSVLSLATHRFWRPRRSSILAFCGLTLVGLVLWVLSPLSPNLARENPALYLVSFDRKLSDEQFETSIQRTPDGVQPLPVARNRRDAALLSLFQVIEWKDGQFEIHPLSPVPNGGAKYSLKLELNRVGETASQTFEVFLPREAEEPETAILTFPDLSLHWVGSKAWSGQVRFNQPEGQTLFLVVTYQLRDQYRASVPRMIPPP